MTPMLRLLAGEDFDTDLRLQNIDFGVYVSGKVVRTKAIRDIYVCPYINSICTHKVGTRS